MTIKLLISNKYIVKSYKLLDENKIQLLKQVDFFTIF